jgi:uncharacterized RDD family membrane protein YckC
MPKKIITAGLFIAVFGLITETAFDIMNRSEWIAIFDAYFSFIDVYDLADIDRGLSGRNYTNIFFYLLLLLGVVLYAFGKKESRLIRFIFSLILFIKAIRLVSSLFFIANLNLIPGKSILLYLIYLSWQVLWIFISYKVLKYFNSHKEFKTQTREYSETETKILVEANRSQRFFNLLADLCVMMLIYIPVFQNLIRVEGFTNFFRPVEAIVGDRGTLYLIMAIARICYYMLFEGLFQSTPGKLLSETRVTNDTGGIPGLGNIAGRTFSRFVPFEALSFLGSHGWHDKWSDTYVLQEKREGVKGSWYFLIFPVFLVLGLAAYFGYDQYQRMQSRAYFKKRFEIEFAEKRDKLNNITTNDIIELKVYPHSEPVYLKAEQINGDDILFTSFERDNGYARYMFEPEKYYMENKENLPKIKISRRKLMSAIPTELSDDEINYKEHVDELLGDDMFYYVDGIDTYFMPTIKLERIVKDDYMGSNIQIALQNKGWKGEITRIKNIKGDVNWQNMLPVRLSKATQYGYNTVSDRDCGRYR